ncbi:MAG: TonB-dependent receptor plug domain-containing protein, partial [Deltaproteobacteria bacterium]|nr:TonB-dependent receptor plug domain-containing protein [Deltaproteobacteria bacterium]
MSFLGAKVQLRHAILALGLILAVSASHIAFAQTVETREVIVTSTRVERDLSEIPLSVGVKPDEEINFSPAQNLADHLSDIPGIQIQDGSMPGSKRIMIRGESPQRSLILIDGVKISEQKSMSGAVIMVDDSQIERIEVIKGPASVLYGSEAIGGVLNIITKKGGDKPLGFSLRASADSSVHGLEVQASVFGQYNGFNYRFSANGIDAGDRRTPNETIGKSGFQNRYFSGRVGYDWGNGEVWLKADSYLGKIHVPPNV